VIRIDTYTPFQSFLLFEQPGEYQLQLLLNLGPGWHGYGAISKVCRKPWVCRGSHECQKMHQEIFGQGPGGL